VIAAALPPLLASGRVDKLRGEMAAQDLDGFVVSGLTSVRWLTGFTGSNGVAVVTNDRLVLITDRRYEVQAPNELDAAQSEADVVISRRDGGELAAALGGSLRVGLEADVVSWGTMRRWSDAVDADLVATSGVLEQLRAVKDDAELARIEEAARCADRALAAVVDDLRVGRTERDITWQLDAAMVAAGASGPAYDTIVASGPNAALPHASPTERAVQSGDLLVIDVGAVVDGYRSDMTRTLVVGGVAAADARSAEIVNLVTSAQAQAVAAVAPGVSAAAIDSACRDVITAAGWGAEFVHGTGHGVGLDIHELPAVHADASAILQRGHVLTVEPGVYIPEFGGVRVEDLVVVTSDGHRVLSQTPKLTV